MPSEDPSNDQYIYLADPPPPVVLVPGRRTRVVGALLVGACLGALSGAVLPWFTPVTLYLQSGASKRWPSAHMWDTGVCILMPLLLAPLIPLARTGVDALRGRVRGRARRRAIFACLLGIPDVLLCGVILGFAVGMSHWNPYWGRGTSTDILLEAGLPVSLASYLFGFVAGLFLPAGDRRGQQP